VASRRAGCYERGAHVRDPFRGTAGLPLVERVPDAEACIVTPDGRLHATPGFPFAA
jgi:hypothetical protein